MPGPAPVWLLDKNVVRKAIEGIGASLIAAPLTGQQSMAIRLLMRSRRAGIRVMITPETANILGHHSDLLEVQLFLAEVEVMRRGRYFNRWVRRLRDYSFTPEETGGLFADEQMPGAQNQVGRLARLPLQSL